MSVIDAIRPKRAEGFPDKLDPYIDARLKRGVEARDKDRQTRELCRKFWKGDQYSFLTPAGNMSYQVAGGAGIVGRGKPVNRIRNTYNYVALVVEGKVSAATQQLPGYSVNPATADPDDEDAASLAEQVAAYGYDKWYFRRHRTKAVTNALVAREGFIRPYFDQNIGPFRDGKGKGDVRLKNLSREQVSWEPEEDFIDSRWHAIDISMRIEEIVKLPGYVPGTLDKAKKDQDNTVKLTVTEYLERPCGDYPQGRRIFFASGKPVVDFRRTEDGQDSKYWWEPFPNEDANGEVADEPVIHRISYTVNPDGDDLGLVERIIDLQRTVNDTWNKILEIKNRALHLQMLARKGSNMQRGDDTPGAIRTYDGPEKPEWEKAPDPGLLSQLLEIHREAISELRALSADVDIQPEARLAEGTAALAQSAAAARWGSFLGDLADFDSRLMRHCLSLVALNYDEERQIDIRGQYGWQSQKAFIGQDLRSQVNVRVLPDSLLVKSQPQKQKEIEWVQANFPGAITPEGALAFIHGGYETGLLVSYRNHVGKARRIIERLKTGPDAFFTFGERFDPTVPNLDALQAAQAGMPLADPETGVPVPVMGVMVPGWMPGPQDNPKIWRQVFSDYMTTQDFEGLEPGIQEGYYQVLAGLDHAEQERAARQAAMQMQQAQSAGMSNAAAPQVAPPMPDRAGFTPENESPVPNTV